MTPPLSIIAQMRAPHRPRLVGAGCRLACRFVVLGQEILVDKLYQGKEEKVVVDLLGKAMSFVFGLQIPVRGSSSANSFDHLIRFTDRYPRIVVALHHE